MNRMTLVIILLATSCAHWHAFWTGHYDCGDMAVYEYTDEPRVRVECDDVTALDHSCPNLRLEWGEPNAPRYSVEVWCGDNWVGKYTSDTIMGEP